MLTRRQFLKTGAAVGAYLALPRSLTWRGAVQKAFAAYVANSTLDGATVTQFAAPMVIPPAMPKSKGSNKNKDKYKIAVRQFRQQILPSDYGPTTVWSYGSIGRSWHVQLPGLYHRGGMEQGHTGSVAQRTGRCCGRTPAAPAAGRSDPALGQSYWA